MKRGEIRGRLIKTRNNKYRKDGDYRIQRKPREAQIQKEIMGVMKINETG